MILGLKYLEIEVLQVILWFLVKKVSCARFLVAAILNRPIWPLGGTFHLSVGRFWNVWVMSACDINFRLLQWSERFDHFLRLSSPTIPTSEWATGYYLFCNEYMSSFAQYQVSTYQTVLSHKKKVIWKKSDLYKMFIQIGLSQEFCFISRGIICGSVFRQMANTFYHVDIFVITLCNFLSAQGV